MCSIGVCIHHELLGENPYIRKPPEARTSLETEANPSSTPPPSPRQYIVSRLRPSQRCARGRGGVAICVGPDRFCRLEHPRAITEDLSRRLATAHHHPVITAIQDSPR
jgi:hypothetical protein